MTDENHFQHDSSFSFNRLLTTTDSTIRYMLSKWKLLLIVAVAGCFAGLGYAFIKKPRYVGELTFVMDEQSGSGLGAYAGLASQLGIDMSGGGQGAFAGDNILQLMKSRSLLTRSLLTVVTVGKKETTLADLYIDFNRLRATWQKNPELKDIHYSPNADTAKFTLQQDSLLGTICQTLLDQNLSIDKIDKKLDFVKVMVVTKNELFSKAFCESLVSNVTQMYVTVRTKKASDNMSILQRQADSIRLELNKAISGTASLVDANFNINPAYQVLRVPSQKKQIDIQTNTGILQELTKNLEIAKITVRRETPFIQVVDRPILPLYKVKQGKLIALITGGCIAFALCALALLSKIFFTKLRRHPV